jgi:hypothetical protein
MDNQTEQMSRCPRQANNWPPGLDDVNQHVNAVRYACNRIHCLGICGDMAQRLQGRSQHGLVRLALVARAKHSEQGRRSIDRCERLPALPAPARGNLQ